MGLEVVREENKDNVCNLTGVVRVATGATRGLERDTKVIERVSPNVTKTVVKTVLEVPGKI